jgi:hypothetical protein
VRNKGRDIEGKKEGEGTIDEGILRVRNKGWEKQRKECYVKEKGKEKKYRKKGRKENRR